MTEEEKEAIENLTNLLSQRNEKQVKITTYDLFGDIKTVLNIIQKQDKEIEHWKNGFERELENNRKNTCELLKQDLIIREKDKQIDLILDVFFKRFTAQLVLEYGIENKEQLKQKFEQYFENKVNSRKEKECYKVRRIKKCLN